jgi:hypothetical protein
MKCWRLKNVRTLQGHTTKVRACSATSAQLTVNEERFAIVECIAVLKSARRGGWGRVSTSVCACGYSAACIRQKRSDKDTTPARLVT